MVATQRIARSLSNKSAPQYVRSSKPIVHFLLWRETRDWWEPAVNWATEWKASRSNHCSDGKLNKWPNVVLRRTLQARLIKMKQNGASPQTFLAHFLHPINFLIPKLKSDYIFNGWNFLKINFFFGFFNSWLII